MKASSPACAPGTAARPASGRRWLRGCREAAAGANPFQIVLHGHFAQLRGHWGVGAWICRKSSIFNDLRETQIFEIHCNFNGLAYPCTNAPKVEAATSLALLHKTHMAKNPWARLMFDTWSLSLETSAVVTSRAM